MGIKRTRIHIPEIKAQRGSLSVSGEVPCNVRQQVIDARIHQGHRHLAAVLALRDGRVHREGGALGLKLSVQNLQRYRVAVLIADRPGLPERAILIGQHQQPGL